MKHTTAILTLAALAMLMGSSVTLARIPGDISRDIDWQISAIGGYFVGDLLVETEIDGETVRGELDTGWLTGVRVGAESEYFGLETRIAGVFADLDVKADPAAGLSSTEDATLLLVNLDACMLLSAKELSWIAGTPMSLNSRKKYSRGVSEDCSAKRQSKKKGMSLLNGWMLSCGRRLSSCSLTSICFRHIRYQLHQWKIRSK